MDVARRGEDTGYGVPCLFIAAKDDLDSYPEAIGDSKAVINCATYLYCSFESVTMKVTLTLICNLQHFAVDLSGNENRGTHSYQRKGKRHE